MWETLVLETAHPKGLPAERVINRGAAAPCILVIRSYTVSC